MRVRIFSEEFPEGRVAEWDAIPREGDVVTFDHRGGSSNLSVRSVRWIASSAGHLQEVELHLVF